MAVIPIVTGSRPFCFWGADLHQENRIFLESLDPEYFRFVALTYADHVLDGDDEEPTGPETEQEKKKDRLRAAIALRNAYGQAVETMLAMLAAAAQAPSFPLGWLTQYQIKDLCEVVGAIENCRPFFTKLAQKPVTWETLSEAVHCHLSPEIKNGRNLIGRYAQFWSRMARRFLADDFRSEYNSIKHGFRVSPGGFFVSMGIQDAPGIPAPPERMQSLGGCEFGTSFFAPVRIEGGKDKHHYTFAHRSRNWRPEPLLLDLQLIAQSIANVVSFCRIVAGADARAVKFTWPSDDNVFDKHGEYLVTLERMDTSPKLTQADIRPVTRQQILDTYKGTQQNPAGGEADAGQAGENA